MASVISLYKWASRTRPNQSKFSSFATAAQNNKTKALKNYLSLAHTKARPIYRFYLRVVSGVCVRARRERDIPVGQCGWMDAPADRDRKKESCACVEESLQQGPLKNSLSAMRRGSWEKSHCTLLAAWCMRIYQKLRAMRVMTPPLESLGEICNLPHREMQNSLSRLDVKSPNHSWC